MRAVSVRFRFMVEHSTVAFRCTQAYSDDMMNEKDRNAFVWLWTAASLAGAFGALIYLALEHGLPIG